jgi:DnaJ-class molecular chaperone
MTVPDIYERPEIECDTCVGSGEVFAPGGGFMTCPDCDGDGWREMTDEEWNDASEAAWERRCEGEPPMSAQEQHERAWRQKQELRR